jgi:hypothetical protein
MESPVEIRYAGVVIGRAQEVRRSDGDSTFFLVVREPMPVGSVLHLRTGDRETPARVVHTVESSDPATSGLQVRLIGESEEVATEWIPPPAPVVEKARPVEEPVKTAMQVIEVDMSTVQSPGIASSAAGVGVETRLQRSPESAARSEQTEFGFPAAAVPEAAPASAVEAGGADSTVAGVAAETASAESAPVATAPTSPASDAAVQAAAAPEASAPAAADDSVATSSAGTAEPQAPAEDLPPARPIAGPSGRRKTKRRR